MGYQTPDTLDRFQPRALTERKAEGIGVVRQVIGGAADEIDTLVPPSREKSLALTKLEEAAFWANAAIARSATEPAI